MHSINIGREKNVLKSLCKSPWATSMIRSSPVVSLGRAVSETEVEAALNESLANIVENTRHKQP